MHATNKPTGLDTALGESASDPPSRPEHSAISLTTECNWRGLIDLTAAPYHPSVESGDAPPSAEHGVEVARKLSTGMVFIDRPTMVKADLPFGGIRHLGYGRELIGLGITEFVNHKLIDVVDINAPF